MTESNREHLSCLMDGELEPASREFLLRRLANDATMNATWRRYHLARACMHQELSLGHDLADRVARALDEEPAPSRHSWLDTWMRPALGSAIAASVAVVAVVGINANLTDRAAPTAVVEQPGFVSQPTVLDHSISRQAVPVSFTETLPTDRERINIYVLRHNQAVGGGFVPYLPIVTAPVAAQPPAPLLEGVQQAREPLE